MANREVPVVERAVSVLIRIRELACEAVTVSTTDHSKWTTLRRIQKYFNVFSDIESSKVIRNLISALRDHQRQTIVVRRHNVITFYSAETVELANSPRKKRKKKKNPAEEPMCLGLDAVQSRPHYLSSLCVNICSPDRLRCRPICRLACFRE
jgi:hypothetical protein